MRTATTIILATLLAMITVRETMAQSIICQPEDSVRIEQMLREGLRQPGDTNLNIYYARQFLNTPYVAATLEVNYAQTPPDNTEHLVVNTRQLDCTTFVETVCALTLTTRQGKTTFADYCRNLRAMRYKRGIISGYASRNHYYTTWIDNAQALGLARELTPDDTPLYSATRQQTVNFMTTHSDLYPALRNPGGQRFLSTIRQDEKNISRTVHYLPTAQLGKAQAELPFIDNGDIIALVTTKAGLDVSHLGFAFWSDDGHLHLLHASSLRKKVILDPATLKDYQLRQKTQLGIRIIKLIRNEG